MKREVAIGSKLALRKIDHETKALRRDQAALAALKKLAGPEGQWVPEHRTQANKLARRIVDRQRDIGAVIPQAFPRGWKPGQARTAERGRAKSSEVGNFLVSMEAFGIDPKHDSPTWRFLADLEPQVFTQACEAVAERHVLSAYLVAKAARSNRIANRIPPEPVETPGFPTGPFSTIVIDPPWPIEKVVLDRRPKEKEQLDYATWTLDRIGTNDETGLPVSRLSNQDGTHIYLWITHKLLPVGLKLFETWGVRYECMLTWIKPTAQPLWWKYNTEHILFGKVGTLPLLKKGVAVGFTASQQRHSHKPEEFFDIVRCVSPEPRLTMFDGSRDGFISWGTVHAQ